MLLFYALLFIAFGFCIGMIVEQDLNKKHVSETVHNCEMFCYDHCKIYESVASQFDDPDDAWRELDNGGHCEGCPVMAAQDILFDEWKREWMKEKGREHGRCKRCY